MRITLLIIILVLSVSCRDSTNGVIVDPDEINSVINDEGGSNGNGSSDLAEESPEIINTALPSFKKLNFNATVEGEIRYHFDKPIKIDSIEVFNDFIEKISEEPYWSNRDQFIDDLEALNITFQSQNIIFFHGKLGVGNTAIVTEQLIVDNGFTLKVEIDEQESDDSGSFVASYIVDKSINHIIYETPFNYLKIKNNELIVDPNYGNESIRRVESSRSVGFIGKVIISTEKGLIELIDKSEYEPVIGILNEIKSEIDFSQFNLMCYSFSENYPCYDYYLDPPIKDENTSNYTIKVNQSWSGGPCASVMSSKSLLFIVNKNIESITFQHKHQENDTIFNLDIILLE
ncbi:MAG: hypothetical protein COA79_15185 [Planctomycetota bacterium]|nr:MAG: hypothetical protein COA79_15185 [Planctomycetota bacterium]